MFKNSVFRVNVDTVKWVKAAGIRAIKTMAQAVIGGIGAAAVMSEVNWQYVGSAALLAGIVSLLTSLIGVPEVEGTKTEKMEVNK